jgi:hypothetical protein
MNTRKFRRCALEGFAYIPHSQDPKASRSCQFQLSVLLFLENCRQLWIFLLHVLHICFLVAPFWYRIFGSVQQYPLCCNVLRRFDRKMDGY